MILQKGTQAPDFELHATPDQKLKLSELKGKARHSCLLPG